MENETLLKEVTAKAQTWLGQGYDEKTKAEVRRMLENEDKTELIESFYKTWNLEQVVCVVLWVLEQIV